MLPLADAPILSMARVFSFQLALPAPPPVRSCLWVAGRGSGKAMRRNVLRKDSHKIDDDVLIIPQIAEEH